MISFITQFSFSLSPISFTHLKLLHRYTHTHTHTHTSFLSFGSAAIVRLCNPQKGGARSMLVAPDRIHFSMLDLACICTPHCTTTLLYIAAALHSSFLSVNRALSLINTLVSLLISFYPEASSTVMHGCGDEVVANIYTIARP